MELQQIIEQIQSEIKVNSDGLGFVSIRGAARLCDVDESAIRRGLKTGTEKIATKLGMFLVKQGFEVRSFSTWSDIGVPDLALSAILEYYAYEAGKRCTELAKSCCRAFRAIGVRTITLGNQTQALI